MTYAPYDTLEAAQWLAKELTEKQIRATCGAIREGATEFKYEALRHTRPDQMYPKFGIIGRWKYPDRPELGWFGGAFVWNPHTLQKEAQT